MGRELDEELLSDHAGRPEHADVRAPADRENARSHASLPRTNKNAGPVVLAGVWYGSVRSSLTTHARMHTTGLPGRLARFRIADGSCIRVMTAGV
jgi:hypothetical protein